jgi:hypothetical protein
VGKKRRKTEFLASLFLWRYNMPPTVRYNGKWYAIIPKPYEPERQTYQVGWSQIITSITAEEAYRKYFEVLRKETKLLCPSFRQDE